MSQGKSIFVLRWIAFLPAALLGATALDLIIKLLREVSATVMGYDPNALGVKLGTAVISGCVWGVAFVRIGAYVAPAHKNRVAYAMGVAGIVACGVALYPVFLQRQWWAGITVAFTIGGLLFEMHRKNAPEKKALKKPLIPPKIDETFSRN